MGLLSYGVARAEFSLEAQKDYRQRCEDQGKDAILGVPDWRSFLKERSLDYPNEICFDSTWGFSSSYPIRDLLTISLRFGGSVREVYLSGIDGVLKNVN